MKRFNRFINEAKITNPIKITNILYDYKEKTITFEETIKLLLKETSDIDYLLLKSYDYYDLIKYFLEKGANPNYILKSPTIICWVAYNSIDDNKLDSIKILIEYGAKLNNFKKDLKIDLNPLTYIFNYENNINSLIYFLEHDAEINDWIIDKINENLPDAIPTLKKYYPIEYKEYMKNKNIKKFNI